MHLISDVSPKEYRNVAKSVQMPNFVFSILIGIGITLRREEGYEVRPTFVMPHIIEIDGVTSVFTLMTPSELNLFSEKLFVYSKYIRLVQGVPFSREGVADVMLATTYNGQILSPSKNSAQ